MSLISISSPPGVRNRWGIGKLTRGRGPTLLTQAVLHELGLGHPLKFIWEK